MSFEPQEPPGIFRVYADQQGIPIIAAARTIEGKPLEAADMVVGYFNGDPYDPIYELSARWLLDLDRPGGLNAVARSIAAGHLNVDQAQALDAAIRAGQFRRHLTIAVGVPPPQGQVLADGFGDVADYGMEPAVEVEAVNISEL